MKGLYLRENREAEEHMDDKGQMHIDYLIGISIFLVGVIFVFSFTAGLFTPFRSSSDETTLIADRISADIVEQVSAGSPDAVNLVNGTKIEHFFTETNADYDGMTDLLGLNGTYLRYDLNVTLENGTGVLYLAGRVLPPSGNIGQTRRIVSLRDEVTGNTSAATISVRVW